MSIAVYMSRHAAELPKGYGAFIHWNIGEKVTVISNRGSPPQTAIVRSELLWHPGAPEVESAKGRGRWIVEVEISGEIYTPSPGQLVFYAD